MARHENYWKETKLKSEAPLGLSRDYLSNGGVKKIDVELEKQLMAGVSFTAKKCGLGKEG